MLFFNLFFRFCELYKTHNMQNDLFFAVLHVMCCIAFDMIFLIFRLTTVAFVLPFQRIPALCF